MPIVKIPAKVVTGPAMYQVAPIVVTGPAMYQVAPTVVTGPAMYQVAATVVTGPSMYVAPVAVAGPPTYFFAKPDLKNASIGDRVWNDSNHNGIQDAGEAGLASQNVYLTGAGQDKVFGTADDVLKSTISDANGHYAFTGLAAGDYKVQFTAWAISGLGVGGYGYNFTTAHVGSNPALDSNAEYPAQVIHLAASERNTSVDGGLQFFTTPSNPAPVDHKNASIGDRVWNDVNHNGLQDAGEAGLANQNVYLTGAGQDKVFGTADDVLKSTTSDANGHYAFTGLNAGDYKVQFNAWAVSGAGVGGYGYKFTTAHVGSDAALDSNAEYPAQVIHLAAGERNTSVDGGLQYFTIPSNPLLKSASLASLGSLLQGDDDLLHRAFGASAAAPAESLVASHDAESLRQLAAAWQTHGATALA